MARPGRLRFAPSHRDKLRAANASNSFYAAMSGKELAPELTNDIKPKRAYTKREGQTPESKVLDQIRDAVRGLDRVKLYRNSRGTVQLPAGGMLRYGVGPNGASDFLGWVSVRVTPEMVGTDVAVFCAIEAKAPKENATPEQSDFLDTVLAAGGIAGVAHCGADAEAILARGANT